jgi:LmbE family N-acetylglucosaminyl deacetylase
VKAGDAILDALAARQRVLHRVLLIAAHPDDETIGLGAQLRRFDDLLLVHVTDGAPVDGSDAEKYGFASTIDYAAARRRELAHALAAGEVRARTNCLGVADQEAYRDLAGLTRRLADLLRAEQPAAVITHAYEGGHPDHDAAAFAVHAACHQMDLPPAILEIALYHREGGKLVSGTFLELSSRRKPGSTDPYAQSLIGRSRLSPGRQLELDENDRYRKQCMIDSFATQRWLLLQFDADSERLRSAPQYDFRHPPHSGTLHYETLDWGISGAEWCQRAALAMAELGFAEVSCL